MTRQQDYWPAFVADRERKRAAAVASGKSTAAAAARDARRCDVITKLGPRPSAADMLAWGPTRYGNAADAADLLDSIVARLRTAAPADPQTIDMGERARCLRAALGFITALYWHDRIAAGHAPPGSTPPPDWRPAP